MTSPAAFFLPGDLRRTNDDKKREAGRTPSCPPSLTALGLGRGGGSDEAKEANEGGNDVDGGCPSRRRHPLLDVNLTGSEDSSASDVVEGNDAEVDSDTQYSDDNNNKN